MERLFQLLETVAPTNSTILITGETGTGKEVVARAIHHNSPRRQHRFVALNCSAIPETLLEAELFGHVRGAFTGAVGNRQGRLEQAHKGTLFLDEVGTMSPALQMKLLRVLQEREFERVGDSHTIKVDVRVIAATNSDLARMVADGQFREDLFYRLNVIPVQLPPLRDRKEDIPLLVQHFLEKFGAARTGAGERARAPMTVSQEAMRRLMASQWPGNVRQLENAIERAVAFSAGRSQIDVGDLPSEIQQAQETALLSPVTLPEEGIDLDAFIAGIERELIQRSLERTGGNKGQAARLLNLKRTTLVEKLKRSDENRPMPPRFAYWTILIDGKPTAFRARDREELLPTLNQLKRTNTDVAMKWFAHGRLWDSPEAERAAASRPAVRREARTRLASGRRPQGSARSLRQEEDRQTTPRQRSRTARRGPAPAVHAAPGVRRSANDRLSPNRRRFDKRPPSGNRPHGGRPPVERASGAPPRPDRPKFARTAGTPSTATPRG